MLNYIYFAVYFNPHSPRGERPSSFDRGLYDFLFQSTLPARGATKCVSSENPFKTISIHTPREGSDFSAGHIVQC